MVDIEVGRVRVYFSVENMAKMGAKRLGYAKYSFWAQNGVVLAFLGPKRRHFSLYNFFKIRNTNQNGVVLVMSRTKTMSFWPCSHLSKTTSFG